MKTEILFIILALAGVILVARRSLKRRSSNKADFNHIKTGITAAWGKEDCRCGSTREKWKPLAMNRPDNTVLLYCPQCRNLWEESMSMYSNKWRPVDEIYAKENYNYCRE